MGSSPFSGPRLPLPIERELHVQLLAADKIAQRAVLHMKNARRMQIFTKVGTKILALYGDDENPVTWYEAEVDRVIPPARAGGYPKFVVTFSEYGNTETVALGEIDVWDASSSKNSVSRSYTHQVHTDPQDLYQEVQQRERDRVAPSDRGSWGARRPPPTTKQSISSSAQQPRNHYSHDRGYAHSGNNDTKDDYQHQPKLPPAPSSLSSHTAIDSRHSAAAAALPAAKKRTNEELAMIAEKKRKLMAKYG